MTGAHRIGSAAGSAAPVFGATLAELSDLAGANRSLAAGAAPDWVHLLPVGRIASRDGRAWTLSDPDALVADFAARGVDLPVDYHHQHDPNSTARDRSGPVPAAGWIKELALRDGGIWGRVEWTAQAAELIGQRAFRYLSPNIVFRPDREVVRLVGAALVHNPNLHLTALNSEDAAMTEPAALLAELAELLGLGPDAAPEELLDAVRRLAEGDAKAGPDMTEANAARPDPARYVPIGVLRDALREHNARAATLSERQVEAKVEDAFRRGYITAGMREWATELCSADEASFEGFLASTTPAYASLHRPTHTAGRPPGAEGRVAADPRAAAIAAQLGLDPSRLAR
jgi:phage I-like protein